MSFLLAALLVGQGVVLPEPNVEHDCKKWDGDKPTRCELALAQDFFDTQQVLVDCNAAYQEEFQKRVLLLSMLTSTPAPEPEGFTLFNLTLPGWVGMVTGAVLITGACTASAFVESRVGSVALCGVGAGLGGITWGLSL